MESYTPLLEKIRVPQPSLQKFAVISIFSKLRSAPTYLDPDSDPGREAITQCLQSSSPSVVDQTVRELCRLVSDSKLNLSRGLLELQSALEGAADSKFVGLFVKGLGFLIRLGFERNNGSWHFASPESHPFVKILSRRSDVQSELVQQVLQFMAQNKRLGMVEVCEFLRPFLNFSVLRIPFSDSLSSIFARQLISSMTSFCCSFSIEAIPVLKLLMGVVKLLPHNNSDKLRDSYYSLESVVDAYTVVLRHLAQNGLLLIEAQLLGVELSEIILSVLTFHSGHSGDSEPIIELVKRLFLIQKDLNMCYIPELSSSVLSLFIILIQSELEHEQLSVLKLLIFLFKWKSQNEYSFNRTKCAFSEELLFTFPIINLMSSTSRSVKGAAADLLLMLEKLIIELFRTPRIGQVAEVKFPSISSLGSIFYRLLQHLWSQDQVSQSTSFFANFAYNDKVDGKGIHHQAISWASQLRENSWRIIDRRKSSLPISQSQEIFLKEMPPLLCAITAPLVAHQSLGNIALEMLATIGILDPKQGVPLLLAVLFYSNILTKNDIDGHNILPKLLAVLPSLASHFVMMPLIIQSILPMLQKNGKPVLYSTGVRLLCQTWSTNDRAFGSLQAVLLPTGFTQFKFDKTICISLATSIRDVCRKNPDRGVDIILSVSACIESQDPTIKALGLQSLAHLCEADLIDFYTAWSVIEKHVVDYSSDPVVAQSMCTLLRWGAMDAEAYPKASESVLQILWNVGASMNVSHVVQMAKARTCAFEALSEYELQHIERGIPEFKRKNMDLLFCETDGDVLKAMEGLQIKIITHEHMNRRRLVKERKVTGNKIEKLLDVFPQVLFPSGKKSSAGQLPGAALLCLSFSPKDVNSLGISRGTVDLHAAYENALVEIASSLQLSRNIFVALLSLQSWKTFMRRWMRANILSLDSKAASVALDKTSKSANNILKSMMRLAEESIPRSAENIALAVGALCLFPVHATTGAQPAKVLPSSAHTITSAASKFLLNWLSQYEHEHRQWSAAISLGLISSCLHVTDHKQKFQNITGLIEVLCGSKSTLVKGACGLGLGFSCQDLLTRVEAADSIDLVRENHKMLEVELLGKIVRTLLLMISQLSQASYDILEDLSPYFPSATDDLTNMTSELLLEKCDDLEEDTWGVAGLILGLGNSVGAIYRAGAHDAVLKIKDLIISWIPHVDSVAIKSDFSNAADKVLSVGSCLALPIIVAFCQRMEMMNDHELDHLVKGYSELITELISVKKSGNFHQSLLMASCIGAGNLLACISNESVHPIEAEHIKGLLELFRKCYSNPYPAHIHLGGMLGVVNSMGSSAGILFHAHHFSSSVKSVYVQKKSSYVLGPLLSNSICETQLTALVQDIFLVAQNSDDLQMRQNAAWAVSFLRNHLWSKELQDVDNSVQNNVSDSRTVSHSFPEDSLVLKLSLWLMHLNFPVVEGGTAVHVATVATVLRCLSRAPRLPTMDWGSIIRRCMRYNSQIFKLLTPESSDRGTLREECLRFSITHANQFDQLLTFLDERSDLSRFRTLELDLQTCLLEYLADLTKIFSGSRLEKLFHDISEFFSSDSLNQMYNSDQKTALRISCWKGLYQCLDEVSLSSLGHLPDTERCMEVLFSFLPALESTAFLGSHTQEWYEVVQCLKKARGEWLSDFLQVPVVDLVQGCGQFDELQKKVVTKAKLVKIGSIPLNELGGLKVHILNSKSHGLWNLLTEVVAALQHAEGSVKKQWLIDAVEISCESSFPSTSLQFVGLLSGSCCKYMPLLTLNPLTVLRDLSVTLTSLLKEPNWEVVAESIVSHLCTSTERMYCWVTNTKLLDDTPNLQPIDKSEQDVVALLLPVMHHACLSLKEYLPLEKQLRLTNMNVNAMKQT